MLGEIGDSKHHRPIFFAAAQAYARAGEAERAVATADEVEESRYRAIVLSQIAVAQHRAGEPVRALETLGKAVAASREIDQRARYPRDYAVAQIALALVAIEAVPKALETAAAIGDARLRTDVLWTIGAAQARTGDGAAARRTNALAGDALAAIKSPLDRAWVLGNLAQAHARAGHSRAAKRAFRQALDIAQDITSPWARTQALAEVAATLLALEGAAM